jgi:hypothetical protein
MKEPNPIQIREAWVLCFLLGIIMINYPFLHIFNKEMMVLGIPLLFLYFAIGWPLSILVIYLFCRTLRHANDKDHDKGGPGSDRKDQR